MKWLAIIKLIIELISQLPFNADESQVRAAVESAMADQNTVSVMNEVSVNAAVTPEELEELISHIVAVLMFFIRRRQA